MSKLLLCFVCYKSECLNQVRIQEDCCQTIQSCAWNSYGLTFNFQTANEQEEGEQGEAFDVIITKIKSAGGEDEDEEIGTRYFY